MKRWNFTVTLMIILLLFTNALAGLKKEKDGKKKLPKVTKPDNINNKNVCTLESNAEMFHCFCHGITPANATLIKCWILGNISRDHHMWLLFSKQPLTTELLLMVMPSSHIGYIPTRIVQYMRDLETFTMMYGHIYKVHSYAFANLTKIHEITLAKNRIVNLNHQAFAHLTNLSSLNLDENWISELNRDVFVDLPNLKKLYIKKNNLSVIQEGAFRQLGHLVELELGENSITVLTKDTFAGLGELKRLVLSYNKISMLGDLTFAELWVLEDLDLEGNDIEFISDRAFAGLTHLWRLNLNNNKLQNLRSAVLDGVPAIINIDLRNNFLETLTYDNVKLIIHNFYNESGYFYISDNNFICDCRLAWMHILRNETKNQILRETLDDLTCYIETDDDTDNNDIRSDSLFSTDSKTVDDALLEDEDPSVNPISEELDDAEYSEDDDDYQQQESLHLSTIQEPRDPRIRRLFQIPLADLPCVEESQPPTQTPRHYINTPAYAEINSNRCSTTVATFSITLSLCAAAIFMYLT